MTNSIEHRILQLLPYRKPFRFVDNLICIDSSEIRGDYTFRDDEFFYEGHFPGNPVTPGVILTEAMAQIGLVSFGIYLLLKKNINIEHSDITPIFTSIEVDFLKSVFASEKIHVISKKVYFRLNKLKCYVEMMDKNNIPVCKGYLSGIFLQDQNQ
ncbi:MAG: hydroxymyristoyl-ACP dehydratase [Bacteroidetes bacterium]|nr:hydroxymyristoyl-ACP dehydratase [Bacteroidota bacterium]MDA1122534.1 hydroxymyristoyl-ACP dehydratase [Bacteroidota bacterium]